MKLKEIDTLKDLLKYCNCNDKSVETLPHIPDATKIFPIEQYRQNKSGSLKLYILPDYLDTDYTTCNWVHGLIYSYNTPIGLLKNNKIFILNNACIRLSQTTDIILKEFNKKFDIIPLHSLLTVCELLDINEGYFKDMDKGDFKHGYQG